ncbi:MULTISPECIES: hypothetical protein [unclassified Variovorax]|uniref:hypothetical protein n=1 Tax=unclassified Variovorax TaxID=663243 RepID=UPI0025754699|nr:MULTISPECIES: hypothetical protein [unclassified Variovorax]MDM0086737.1 hypothetical protein [Variovorax sp. J22G40]MDM0145007.1 hypothetical protein [Variovorax sp. J2P1-31]
MGVPDVTQLLDHKWVISAVSLVIGGLISNLIGVLRSRVRVLEYSVAHDRVAIAANDLIFGTVQVSWNGQDVTNLSFSRVLLTNGTGKDLADLSLKAYAGQGTTLLTQQPGIMGLSDVLPFTASYEAALKVSPGEGPTDAQRALYHRERRYTVPVFNRGQTIELRYLTMTGPNVGPSVWLDMQHVGLKLVHRELVPLVHGVPLKLALAIGLVSVGIIYALSSLFIQESWAAAGICLLAGLSAQLLGAAIFKAFRGVTRVVLR